MEVKIEIIDRNYEQIREFCEFNNITIEDYIVQCVEDDFFIRKYGDLNDKINKKEEKTEEVPKEQPKKEEEPPKVEKKKPGRPKKKVEEVKVEEIKEEKIEEIPINNKTFVVKKEENVDTTDKALQTKITRIRRTLKTK